MVYGARTLRKLLTFPARKILGTITHVSTDEPIAALTFDDGPNPEFTPRLLDVLAKHKAQATFFMVGEQAQRYPALVRQAALAGHTIGNHSWDHQSLPSLSGRERRAQMRACADALAPYGQRLFRPPYGHQSVASRLDALWLRYQVVTWNVGHAKDWLQHDAEWMAEQLTNNTRPGSVIILHDALYRSRQAVPPHDRAPMIAAVDIFLSQVGNRFQFVTIPELLRRGRPVRKNWYGKG